MENESLDWLPVGLLDESNTDFAKFARDIGIYRARLEGVVVYIGKATELDNGGFRKRLRDYTRQSDSARTFPAGRRMFEHRNEIEIDLLIFDRSVASIAQIDQLETQLVSELRPSWNTLKK